MSLIDEDTAFGDALSDESSDSDNEQIASSTSTSSKPAVARAPGKKQLKAMELTKKIKQEFQNREVKLVFTGNGSSGKTCLLIRAATGKFPEDYVPTVFDNYVAKLHGKKYSDIDLSVGFWDTFSRGDNRLRPLSYINADVIVVAFSVASRWTFDNVESEFLPEVRQHCPNAKCILLGLKADLRDDPAVIKKLQENGEKLTPREEAEALAQKYGLPYFEISSLKDPQGVIELFQAFCDFAIDRSISTSIAPKKPGFMAALKRMFGASE